MGREGDSWFLFWRNKQVHTTSMEDPFADQHCCQDTPFRFFAWVFLTKYFFFNFLHRIFICIGQYFFQFFVNNYLVLYTTLTYIWLKIRNLTIAHWRKFNNRTLKNSLKSADSILVPIKHLVMNPEIKNKNKVPTIFLYFLCFCLAKTNKYFGLKATVLILCGLHIFSTFME